LGGVTGKICQALPLLGGCPPSSSTEAPAPPLAPTPPAIRPAPRFLTRVSMLNVMYAERGPDRVRAAAWWTLEYLRFLKI